MKFNPVVLDGQPVVIIYDKDDDGTLRGQFAGTITYNLAKNAASYNFIGVNPDREDQYGKYISGSAYY